MTYTPARGTQAALPAPVLREMSQEDFIQVILDALGADTDQAIWDALTDESVVSRTKEGLAGILTDVGMQITQANADLDQLHAACLERGPEGKREYFQAKAEQASWRSRTTGFRRIVQRRYTFVKSRSAALAAARQVDNGLTKPSRKHNRATLESLARAVAIHQRRVTSGDGDESDDETLWACLTCLTAMIRTGEELPLGAWLDYLDDERGDED